MANLSKDNISLEDATKLLKRAVKELHLWQGMYNRAQDELEGLTKEKRLRVLIEPEDRIINNYLEMLNPIDHLYDWVNDPFLED